MFDIKPVYLRKHYLFQNWFVLTIVIEAYFVNVVVDIKPIHLNKHYLFQNKICDLDKIYKLNSLPSQLKNIYFIQPKIKM